MPAEPCQGKSGESLCFSSGPWQSSTIRMAPWVERVLCVVADTFCLESGQPYGAVGNLGKQGTHSVCYISWGRMPCQDARHSRAAQRQAVRRACFLELSTRGAVSDSSFSSVCKWGCNVSLMLSQLYAPPGKHCNHSGFQQRLLSP